MEIPTPTFSNESAMGGNAFQTEGGVGAYAEMVPLGNLEMETEIASSGSKTFQPRTTKGALDTHDAWSSVLVRLFPVSRSDRLDDDRYDLDKAYSFEDWLQNVLVTQDAQSSFLVGFRSVAEFSELNKDPFDDDTALSIADKLRIAPADVRDRYVLASRILSSPAQASFLSALLDREVNLESRIATGFISTFMLSEDVVLAQFSAAVLLFRSGANGRLRYRELIQADPTHKESIQNFVSHYR